MSPKRAARALETLKGRDRLNYDALKNTPGFDIAEHNRKQRTLHRGGAGTVRLTIEIPTGVVNGVNTVFTVSHAPVFVAIDGQTRIAGYGYTYAAGTITTDALTPPTEKIVSFYLA